MPNHLIARDSLEGRSIIAEVHYIRPQRDGGDPEFARLHPLLIEEENEWKPVQDAVTIFPDEGYIFWWNPSFLLTEGSIWHINLKLHPKYNEPGHDRYQADRPAHVFECMIAQSGIGEPELRRILSAEGIRLPTLPANKWLFQLIDGRWVGPISLVEGPQEGHWIAAPQDRVSAEFRKIDDASLIHLRSKHGFHRIVLSPYYMLPPTCGHICLQGALEVLGCVVQRIHKLDKGTHEALAMTFKAYKGYLQAIERSGLVDPQLEEERSRSDAVRLALEIISTNKRHLDEIAKLLLDHPAVAPRIEEAVAIETKRRISEAEALIIERLEEAEVQLASIQAQTLQEQQEYAIAQKKLADTKRSLSEEVERAENLIQGRVEEFFAQPLEPLTDSLIVHAFARALGGRHSNSPPIVQSPSPGIRSSGRPDHPPLRELSAIRARLVQAAVRSGVSPFTAQTILGVLLAGSVPVLFGPGTDAIIDCLAKCLTGGQVHWLPVSSATYQVQDLFGHIDAQGVRFIQTPGSLLPVTAAAREQQVMLAVLEGANRAPPEAYLGPVLRAIRTCVGYDLGVPIPLGAGAVPGDPAGLLFWPPQLLLIATVLQGSSVFTFPRSAIADLTFIPTGFGPPAPEMPSLVGRTEVSSCDSDLLQTTLEKVASGDLGGDFIKALFEVPVGSYTTANQLRRLACGLKTAYGEESPEELCIATAILLGALPAVLQDSRTDFLESMKPSPEVYRHLGEPWAHGALESIDCWLSSDEHIQRHEP